MRREENLDKARPRCCADVVIRYQWINNQRRKKTFGRRNDRLSGDCNDADLVGLCGGRGSDVDGGDHLILAGRDEARRRGGDIRSE